MACSWLPTRGNLGEPFLVKDQCHTSYQRLEDAQRACEAHSWCGGIVRHGGIFCFPAADKYTYQLRGTAKIAPTTITSWLKPAGCRAKEDVSLPPRAWSAPSVQCGRKKPNSAGAAADLLTASSDLVDAAGRWTLPDSHGGGSSSSGGAPHPHRPRQLSIAIATCCRFNWLSNAIFQYLRNPYVAEVIVTDDCRTDAAALDALAGNISLPAEMRARLLLVPNKQRLWPFRNKYSAVERARPGAWIALLDSDNFAPVDTYFAPLFEHWEAVHNQRPDPQLIFQPINFAPDRGAHLPPNGTRYDREAWLAKTSRTVIANAGNHVFQRETALNAWRHTAESSDQAGRDGRESLLINNLMIEHGASMVVVPRMTYVHRITDDSFFSSRDANRRRDELEKAKTKT